MNNFKRHFTEEAFLFSTFVEFNKCWGSGKKSRLVIESVNGLAFVNFSSFLGHPKTMHFAPRENRDPGRKPKQKSKRKTERDNERAARFQAKKRQERDAAVPEASKANHPSTLHGQEKDAAVPEVSRVNPPPATSSPKDSGQSTFVFAEPSTENVSTDSNFANMNVDGNATISPPEPETRDQAVSAGVPPIESQEVAVKTQPLEFVRWRLWAPHSEWFKTNIEKIQPEPHEYIGFKEFTDNMLELGFALTDINSILGGKKTGHNKQLMERFQLFKKNVAIDRFADLVDNCRKKKTYFGMTEPIN